jgi:hypothetical protein
MKIPNFSNVKNEKIEKRTEVKTQAEFLYKEKGKNGKVKEKKFVSNYVSTIDIPYGKYILK